jgi:hypothetical protein
LGQLEHLEQVHFHPELQAAYEGYLKNIFWHQGYLLQGVPLTDNIGFQRVLRNTTQYKNLRYRRCTC